MNLFVKYGIMTRLEDWQMWCAIGGVSYSSFADLAAVVADSTAMNALAGSSAAVDYMVDSSDITTAVLGSSKAITALDGSSPITIPVMLSNTTPSGTASASSVYGGSADYQPYKAMNNIADPLKLWISTSNSYVNESITYYNPSANWVYKIGYRGGYSDAQTSGLIKNYKIYVSDNGTDFTEAKSGQFANSAALQYVTLSSNVGRHKYIRLFATDCWNTSGGASFGVTARIFQAYAK